MEQGRLGQKAQPHVIWQWEMTDIKQGTNTKTAEMFQYGLQHMDWLVFAWVTRNTAIIDTWDSFHTAWISVNERYLPLSFWHFFFTNKMDLYRVL